MEEYGTEEWKTQKLHEISLELRRVLYEVEQFHASTFLYKVVFTNLIAGIALLIAILK